MKNTHHVLSRISQRGITANMLDVLLAFGVCHGDKVYLSKKQAIELKKEIEFLLLTK